MLDCTKVESISNQFDCIKQCNSNWERIGFEFGTNSLDRIMLAAHESWMDWIRAWIHRGISEQELRITPDRIVIRNPNQIG